MISIHTPTKGATTACIRRPQCHTISIHTPTKGATTIMDAYFDVLTDFNPHSHEGSDNKRKLWAYSVRNFNPHSHEGSDWDSDQLAHSQSLFQSTLPRRERPYPPFKSSVNLLISIHTPTKGATKCRRAVTHDRRFQSTLPRRERP